MDSSNAMNYVRVHVGTREVTDDVFKGSESVWNADEDRFTLRVTPNGNSLDLTGSKFRVSNVQSVTISVKVAFLSQPVKTVQYIISILNDTT